MRRFFRNKDGSLYVCDDEYTKNELSIRICNSSYCDYTMIEKKALFAFANAIKSRQEFIETDRSQYQHNAYFSAEKREDAYFFKIRGAVSMYITLNMKQSEMLADYLINACEKYAPSV